MLMMLLRRLLPRKRSSIQQQSEDDRNDNVGRCWCWCEVWDVGHVDAEDGMLRDEREDQKEERRSSSRRNDGVRCGHPADDAPPLPGRRQHQEPGAPLLGSNC